MERSASSRTAWRRVPSPPRVTTMSATGSFQSMGSASMAARASQAGSTDDLHPRSAKPSTTARSASSTPGRAGLATTTALMSRRLGGPSAAHRGAHQRARGIRDARRRKAALFELDLQRRVIHDTVGETETPGLGRDTALGERAQDGGAESAPRRALLDRQEAGEAASEVVQHLVVEGLEVPAIDDLRLDALAGQRL